MNVLLITDFFDGSNPSNLVTLLIAVIGIIITIIGIIITVRTIKKRKPVYAVETISIIHNNIQKDKDLKIFYGEDEVENVSISKIALWNEGKETIRSNDIASTQPLKIVLNNKYDILNAEILFQKNDGNNFEVSIAKDKKSVNITFEYFDKNDGVIIQIVHTGNSKENITIAGKIKSVKHIKEKYPKEKEVRFAICLLFWSVFSGFFLFPTLLRITDNYWTSLFGNGLSFFVILGVSYIIYSGGNIPKDFKLKN